MHGFVNTAFNYDLRILFEPPFSLYSLHSLRCWDICILFHFLPGSSSFCMVSGAENMQRTLPSTVA